MRLDTERPPLALDMFTDALRATLPDNLRHRFVLPPDFAALLDVTGGACWRSTDEWHALWGTDAIVSNLALGSALGHRAARQLRLVLEGNDVITAFPVIP